MAENLSSKVIRSYQNQFSGNAKECRRSGDRRRSVESVNNFQWLADIANDAITVVSDEDLHLYANHVMCEITGYSKLELLNISLEKLVHPDNLDEIKKNYDKLLSGENASHLFETKIVRKADQVIPIEISPSKITWQGRPAVLAICRDITARKIRERRHLKAREELEGKVAERKKALSEITINLERGQKELQTVNQELMDTNKTLAVLARNMDRKKEEAEKAIAQMLHTKIFPILKRAKHATNLAEIEPEISILSIALKELDPGIKNGSASLLSLTVTELQIANMIKAGLKSNEIADALFISEDTVKTHRRNIRKKLNLRNAKVNLRTYLQSQLG
jgi:PAS domain S-box-containing protein